MLLDRVDRYIFFAPLPYFFIALAVFTLILVVQQATKFAELLSSTQFPLGVALKLLLLIVPGVLIFTLPMAAIIGAAVGYSRLLNDSELTALKACGVSTGRCLRPAFLGGTILLALSLYVGFVLIPLTARQLRRTAGEVVLERLSSPVEPKSFFTGFTGKVIYVQSGDMEDGTWRNIFIHWQADETGLRLITAERGRLNNSADGLELYLRNAIVTSIGEKNQITSERASELHLRDERLDQYKSSFIEKLRGGELSDDERSWQTLYRKAKKGKTVQERRDALVALHRRLALCVSPLVLVLVGSLTVLRVRRGGKLSGVFIAVLSMLLYYLLFLAGEQLTRGGVLVPALGLWLAPLGFSLLAVALLLMRPATVGRNSGAPGAAAPRAALSSGVRAAKGLSIGLFDRYVLKSLGGLFIGILITLNLVFLLFTLFELLKFISRNGISARTVFNYLLYLTPYSALLLVPACVFFAVLINFTLMARRSEAVVWLNSGLSVLRVIAPALAFSLLVGLGAQYVQNSVSPTANRRQNDLRRYIRSGERTLAARSGEVWVSVPEERRIYLFGVRGGTRPARLERISFYEFDDTGVHLRRVVRSDSLSGAPGGGAGMTGTAYEFGTRGGRAEPFSEKTLSSHYMQPLKSAALAPEELSNRELSDNLRLLKDSDGEAAPVAVEIESRRAAPLIPLILALVAAPFTFLHPRQNLTKGIYQSVLLLLLYLVASGVGQNLGAGGYLPAAVAVWSVPVLFASFGLYLLTRVRT
jgi:lipopolysaccharide export system permease protein